MCTSISSKLFKINDEIEWDQDINNIQSEMFVDGPEMKSNLIDCIAATYELNVTLKNTEYVRQYFASVLAKVKSLRQDFAKQEQLFNTENSESALNQINLAIDFIESFVEMENVKLFMNLDDFKTENVTILATSSKSFYEIFIDILYSIISSKTFTILVDKKRDYLPKMLEAIIGNYKQVKTTYCPDPNPFCTQIIFDSADYQSAFNVLANAFTDNTAPWKIRSCWIQDTLRTKFFNSFESLINGGRKLSDEQKTELENVLKTSEKYNAKVIQSKDKSVAFLVDVSRKHIDSDLCVVVNFFRTPKEAISLVQSTDCTNSISLWSESISLAYDVADKLKVDNIWINSNGLVNPEIPFSFIRDKKKVVYGTIIGILQMFDFPKKDYKGNTFPKFSSVLTIPGKYHFQTTALRNKNPPIVLHVEKFQNINFELQKLIDLGGVNDFKTIAFPFGQIFSN